MSPALVRTTTYLVCLCAATQPGATDFADVDVEGNPIFAKPRFHGFAAAYRIGFAKKLILVGPTDEAKVAIPLLERLGVKVKDIETFDSPPNTDGNIAAIKVWKQKLGLTDNDYVISSGSYHNRPSVWAWLEGMRCLSIPAEAFLFAEQKDKAGEDRMFKEVLDSLFGHCWTMRFMRIVHQAIRRKTFIEVSLDDTRGIGVKLAGRYKPKTT